MVHILLSISMHAYIHIYVFTCIYNIYMYDYVWTIWICWYLSIFNLRNGHCVGFILIHLNWNWKKCFSPIPNLSFMQREFLTLPASLSSHFSHLYTLPYDSGVPYLLGVFGRRAWPHEPCFFIPFLVAWAVVREPEFCVALSSCKTYRRFKYIQSFQKLTCCLKVIFDSLSAWFL